MAKIVPKRLSTKYSSSELLKASGIEWRELVTNPSWKQLMRMRFFDDNGVYFHPLLFVYPKTRLYEFVIDSRLDFPLVGLQYRVLRMDWLWSSIYVDVRWISESEALALEIRNCEVIEQVDAILTKPSQPRG